MLNISTNIYIAATVTPPEINLADTNNTNSRKNPLVDASRLSKTNILFVINAKITAKAQAIAVDTPAGKPITHADKI